MFIYRIYNVETQESYIGQTTKTVEYRFQEHVREAKRALRGEKRAFPYFHRILLYYGIDKFRVETLEEVADELADTREMFWINYYDSYYKGYNSTKGGQNRSLSELAIETNQKWAKADNKDIMKDERCNGGMNIQDVIAAGLYNPIGNLNAGKTVGQYNLNGELINTYPAASVASQETGISAAGIRNTCNGIQKKSGGYIWKWI